MNAMEWLGVWEEGTAPGRHSRVEPVTMAGGYVYHPGQVIRAIPVSGAVTDAVPSWNKSPQVRFWLAQPKKSLGQRIREWLTK